MRRGLARRTVIGGTAVVTAGVLALSGSGPAQAGGTTTSTGPVSTVPAGPQPAPPAAPDTAGPGSAEPGAGDPDGTTAAEKHGWGEPLPASDEFDYTGPPDPARWNTPGECWPGHDGNGGRCASRTTIEDGKLVQTGLANGDSGWVASTFNQQYGRWEARVRSAATGPDNGRQYHPLLIIWPESDRWPQDGEYDFLENGAPGEDCAEAFIHYPHGRGPIQQEFVRESDCGAPLTEWHNVAVEWTPDHIAGFIDGREWFRFTGGAQGSRRDIQAMPSGHLTIQLDNFFGGDMQPARYEVDWVRIYPLDGGDPGPPAPGPAPDPVAEPTDDPATGPTDGPGPDPAAGPAPAPAAEPANDPAPDPAADPAAEPAEGPASDPVSGPAADPAAGPAPGPVPEPASDPADDPAAAPVDDPTPGSAPDPAPEPAADPAPEPAADPAARPAAE